MLDNLQERVEQLARMAVLTDAQDLPGLVAMQEQAVALATDLPEDQAHELAQMAAEIGKLAEAIVLREVSSADDAFGQIGDIIKRLQDATTDGVNASGDVPEAESPSEDDELISSWISSCEGMLTDLEGWLLKLDAEPESEHEEISDIRRTLHTLKGECGVFAFHTAQRLCHEAETLIDERVNAKQRVPIDPLLSLLDWMKEYILRLSADHKAEPTDDTEVIRAILAAQKGEPVAPEPASSETQPASPPASVGLSPVADGPLRFACQAGTEDNLADFLCEAHDHIAGSEEALLALEQDSTNVELINTVFRAFHTIKGVSGFMALKPIVSLAHSAEQLLDAARSGSKQLQREDLDLVLRSCDMMTRLLDVLEGGTGPNGSDFTDLVARLDAAATGQSSVSGAPARARPARVTPAPAAEPAAPLAPAPEAVSPASPAAPEPEAGSPGSPPLTPSKLRKSDQTVKVNTTRMDNLVTMVGELVIAQQMMVQDVSGLIESSDDTSRVQRTLGHMGKMIRDLQEVSMSLRMVNLKSTFQKMTRLVRDVSQKAGKHIEVVTEGDDVELDRNVVEAITDPLVHMIRNSCDHGIEGADERKAAGKSPKGRVTLRAYHSGGSIVIEITDDGRGLDRTKLLKKARTKGLIPDEVDESAMADSEVFSLIFLPGFSTAEKVTDISGRGVGMDVVRRNIEALRGKIEIRSALGKGTTFLMQLPLTMAIIDGMVVRVGSQRYVLPTLSIQQSFRPRREDIKSAIGKGEMAVVRGAILPIYRLSRVLELDSGTRKVDEALLIVMEADNARFCLMVDEIIGQHQVVIKTLTQTGQPLKGVAGGAILGDGRVALILDVAQIVSLAREGTPGTACFAANPGRSATLAKDCEPASA